jgi:hypothetical protein
MGRLGGIEYFRSIGYTGGWGHFHIPDSLFLDLREYLLPRLELRPSLRPGQHPTLQGKVRYFVGTE